MVKKAIQIIYTNYLVKVMFTRIIYYALCSVGRSVGVGRVGARLHVAAALCDAAC